MCERDPAMEAEQYANDADRWLEARPICDSCGDHIQDTYGHQILGDLYCDKCFEFWVKENLVDIDNMVNGRD